MPIRYVLPSVSARPFDLWYYIGKHVENKSEHSKLMPSVCSCDAHVMSLLSLCDAHVMPKPRDGSNMNYIGTFNGPVI